MAALGGGEVDLIQAGGLKSPTSSEMGLLPLQWPGDIDCRQGVP